MSRESTGATGGAAADELDAELGYRDALDELDAELGYRDALDELEDLLDDLEGADVDVDVLAERVARGVELIRLCRARLDVVTADVDAVVAELESLDGSATASAPPPAPSPGQDAEPAG